MENNRTRICICYLITSFLISVFIYTLISGNLQNNRALARLREEVDEISHVVLHSGADCKAAGGDNKQLTEVIDGILKKKLSGIWDDLYTLKKQLRGAECSGLGGGRRNAITQTDSTDGGGQVMEHRVNYASADLGARIHAVVAVPICPTNIIKQLLNLDFSSNPPIFMLRQSMEPGNCFGFRNNKSEVTVKLAKEIYVEMIEVAHISRAHSPVDDISSAPRKFFVYGIDGSRYDLEFCLGSFEFTNNGSCVQTFPVKTLIHVKFVRFKFESNHGHPNYTCVYRIAVYGKLK